MNDVLPDQLIETLKVMPPAGTAVLSVFGYPIADAVSAVMFFWACTLLIQALYKFYWFVKKRKWEDEDRQKAKEERDL